MSNLYISLEIFLPNNLIFSEIKKSHTVSSNVNQLSKPSSIRVKKNKIDQNEEAGIRDKAIGYALNARPGPDNGN